MPSRQGPEINDIHTPQHRWTFHRMDLTHGDHGKELSLDVEQERVWLGMFVQVQCLQEAPAVLSLSKIVRGNRVCVWVASKSATISLPEWEKGCKTNNHIPLVVPDVQAIDHQIRALGDPKQIRSMDDQLQVETDSQEPLQPVTEGFTTRSSRSTNVFPVDL